MKRFATCMILAVGLSSASLPALAAPSLHAGEWETRTDNGAPTLICMHEDHVFDQPTMARMMAQTSAKCGAGQFSSFGSVTHYNTICEVAGGHLTVRTTITSQGPNGYITRSQSHFEGGTIKMPDMDISQVARRLGACRPGDQQSPY